MRFKLISAILLLTALTFNFNAAQAQSAAQNDTIYNPNVLFNGMPRTYEIADIQVTGADNYEDFVILGFAGIKAGDKVEIPGADISDAAKRLMRQSLFSQVQVKVNKIVGDKAWLEIVLRPQPRISEVNYIGAKKGERNDLQERLQLMKGNQITPNIVNRIEAVAKKYYADKGFNNAEVKVNLHEDLSHKNEMIVDIVVNRHDKVKVNKIHITGNDKLSDVSIQKAMKKTREKNNIRNLLRSKKFVEQDYKDDLNRIIQKYNEKGYRDARIVADSVVAVKDNLVDVYITVDEGKKYYIKDISWVGNTIYPTEVLDATLEMKPGDVYNQKLLNKRLSEDDDAVSNLYMDNGYLFFNLVPIEREVTGDSISLEMRIMEGPQARINNVVINGNDRLYEKVLRRELRVKPGKLFSKADLMRSAREIAQMGHFNPENMDIQPQPKEEDGTVDIIFNLESKANDQIEFSMGWGQTGIIGKVALKFTNFSMKNLLHPSTYKGIIPQGEGQTFTISAQTNARYYQSYSVQFIDPWFGGKRPNALSLGAYYMRQTGVNSSYYNSTWSNSYLYGYNSSLYNDYYTNSLENAYDPNKVLQMIGLSAGISKRLRWPDDFFVLTTTVGYNWYYLKNWEYLYYMNNGTSNALYLNLSLSRNSTDNPLYTRSGSMFQLDFQFTPPASLFGKKDWAKLESENTEAAKAERYKWIEYWKLRFKSRTYTPLIGVNTTYTPVLMTRADFGLLGSYNKHLKSPFETFYVGGDGMSGGYTYSTETIALRGYDNGQLTPWGHEGYAYSRLGLEIHFPLLLQPTTTIYALGFVEGGNAWSSVKDFNPFDMKRSAGAGVRIYLPMVGLMGIDWAYGFDKAFGMKGGSHFHFILGQEF